MFFFHTFKNKLFFLNKVEKIKNINYHSKLKNLI